MAGSSATLRFTIQVNGTDRVILSAGKSKKGDIFLWPKAGDQYRLPGRMSPHTPGIRNIHFSIHPSPTSPDANLVKSKIIRTDDVVESAHFLTKAIKSKQSFSYLAGRRCSHLGSPTFALTKTSGINCSLGTYDPNYFSLVFGIFVGPPGVSFGGSTNQVNVIQRTLDTVELVIGWAFLSVPSGSSGFISRWVTSDWENPGEPPKGLTETQAAERIAGYPPAVCLRQFQQHCGLIWSEYLASIQSGFGEPFSQIAAKMGKFFKVGRVDDPTFLVHLQRLKAHQRRWQEYMRNLRPTK